MGENLMSYLKNTLNFASYSYDASTDTPALAKMKDGTVFEVATAGKVVGTAISGCTLGADSYLLVGDKVVYKNGGHELLSPKIKNGTTINVGAGGLFAKFKDANDYISQRVYTGVILNLLSTTVETSSIDVQNPCGGRLVIMGNGFFIDHSGTVNTNCVLSGNNIYIDNFKVKANHATQPALSIKGEVEYSNALTSTNTVVAQWGLAIPAGSLVAASRDAYGQATAGAISVSSFSGGVGGKAVLFSVDTNGGEFSCGHFSSIGVYGPITTGGGRFRGGNSCSNSIGGAINTGGGQFYAGSSCSNIIIGAINTGGGGFNGGNSCSNFFNGAITTGGGAFSAGECTNNLFQGSITTSGGMFDAGGSCCNRFISLVSVGAGSFGFGTLTINYWNMGATGTGGVVANAGSYNKCNGQPMPAGTPASGTITAAFIRVN
jgi:hypothetical protein